MCFYHIHRHLDRYLDLLELMGEELVNVECELDDDDALRDGVHDSNFIDQLLPDEDLVVTSTSKVSVAITPSIL